MKIAQIIGNPKLLEIQRKRNKDAYQKRKKKK